ncbi:MAG: YceI family protein [Flavobacteriales bacterium]
MKKTVLFAAVAALILSSCGSNEETTQEVVKAYYTVDTEASVINWHGYKTYTPDYGHKGTLMLNSGTINTEDGVITNAEFVIDMNSINEPTDTSEAKKLRGHLMSDHFFNVASHTNASLKITGFENGNAKGELTVMGVSKAIEFPATVTIADDKLTATAEFEYDLGQFGSPYLQVPSEDADAETKQGAISPNVKFSVNIVANK